MNKIKNFFQTAPVSKIILILAILLVFLLVLQSGIAIGFRKASFTCNWDRSWSFRPNDPRSVMAPFMMNRVGGNFDPNPRGVNGEIISINLPQIMVKEPNASEKIVLIGDETSIRYQRQNASTSDLGDGDQIIVIGKPDENGRIRASLIRILSPLK